MVSCSIPLTRGATAIVDESDYEELSQYKWQLSTRGYVQRIQRSQTSKSGWAPTTMHRHIMRPEPKQFVDHINGNPLDNRRENLRIVNENQSAQNCGKAKSFLGKPTSSKYKGVTWYKPERKWQAQITANRHYRQLGRFAKEEDAARAYDAAAHMLHGAYARLNFPEEDGFATRRP